MSTSILTIVVVTMNGIIIIVVVVVIVIIVLVIVVRRGGRRGQVRESRLRLWPIEIGELLKIGEILENLQRQ